MHPVEGHVAITGASAGIGHAIARAFARAPNKLTLVARRRVPMEALAFEAASAGVPTHVVDVDMANLEQSTAWVTEAENRNGPIDILVLNAGVQRIGPALSVGPDEAERLLRVNLMAPIRLARRVAPGMVSRGRGAIVVISSMSAIAHAPQMCDYSASKAAMSAFFETLNVELRGSGVHVVTVYPGPVATGMDAAARARLENVSLLRNLPTGEPDELARRVRRALRKGSSRLVYPRIYGVLRFARVTGQWLAFRLAPRSRAE